MESSIDARSCSLCLLSSLTKLFRSFLADTVESGRSTRLSSTRRCGYFLLSVDNSPGVQKRAANKPGTPPAPSSATRHRHLGAVGLTRVVLSGPSMKQPTAISTAQFPLMQDKACISNTSARTTNVCKLSYHVEGNKFGRYAVCQPRLTDVWIPHVRSDQQVPQNTTHDAPSAMSPRPHFRFSASPQSITAWTTMKTKIPF